MDGVATRTKFSDAVCGTVAEEESVNPNECQFGMKLFTCDTTNPNDLGAGEYTTLRFVLLLLY